MNEWISTRDALPEPYTLVLAIEDKDCFVLAYAAKVWQHVDRVGYEWRLPGFPNATPKVTHWMPLPEPPEKVTR